MNQASSDEISPWEQDHHFNIFTIQYQDKNNNLNNKQSLQHENVNTTISSKRRNSQNQKLGSKYSKKHVSMKNYIPNSLNYNSQQEFIHTRTNKLKTKTKLKQQKIIKTIGVKSTIIQPKKFQMDSITSTNFVIKKHQKVRKFSRVLFKQIKIEDIFRKIYDIQNPSHRKNISLPKIQLKI